MKIKTNELTGTALDWAVAKCEREIVNIDRSTKEVVVFIRDNYFSYSPSTEWTRGGPIIEREKMSFMREASTGFNVKAFYSMASKFEYPQIGTTMLEAAMRCYVASKLGDEVDVPDVLCDI